MSSLHRSRCFNHFDREAIARCPQCTRFYCRECITEHDNRVLCSECLKLLNQPATKKQRNFGVFFLPLGFLVVFLFTWICFYSLAEILLRIPSSFHEGRLEFINLEE